MPSQLRATTLRYLEGTNILETTFATASGVLVTTDFMPIQKRQDLHPAGQDVTSERRIVRLLRCTRGSVACVLEMKPTFGFATEQVALIASEDGALVFQGRNDTLHVHGPSPWVQSAGQVSATLRLRAGDVVPLVLTYAKRDAEVTSFNLDVAQRALEETRTYWEEWSQACT